MTRQAKSGYYTCTESVNYLNHYSELATLTNVNIAVVKVLKCESKSFKNYCGLINANKFIPKLVNMNKIINIIYIIDKADGITENID